MNKAASALLFCAFISAFSFPQDKLQKGGYVLPSVGNVNALYVFAQFPDDNQDPGNEGWKKGQPIKNMDSWSNDMKSYFAEMSGNKFTLTGKAVSIITPHSRQWYLDHGKRRYDIQKEIIEDLDKKMDFAEFDKWAFRAPFKQENKPDSIVDFIFFIWRNISHDLKDVSIGASKLDFGRYGDLGRGPDIKVDNGARIVKTGYGVEGNKPGGSGITICDYFNENMFRFCIHEFGHYLEGDNSMHTGFGFWGLCSAFGVVSFVVNSYERYRLGWGDILTLPYSEKKTTKNITLPDFITTGKSLRIPIDKEGTKFFFIENHQKKSRWEKDTTYGHVKEGIYVLRQDADYGEAVHLISAEGRFDWEVNKMVKNPWGSGELPVFKLKKPDRGQGYGPLDLIPYKVKGSPQSPAAIHFSEDVVSGAPVKDVKYSGIGRDAFNIGYKEVFTPYSNPNSQLADRKPSNIGFVLKEQKNGVFTLDIFQGTSDEAPPSKPELISLTENKGQGIILNWDPNTEPDMVTSGKYKIYRANDVNGKPGIFSLIKTLDAYSKNDTISSFTDRNTLKGRLYYRISAVDKTGKESLPSEYKFIQKTD